MRTTKCRPLISAALAVLLLISVLPVAAISDAAPTLDEINSLKAQASDIAAEKAELEEKIENAENEKFSLLAKKSALDDQIELTIKEIDIISDEIELYKQLISEKEAEVKKAQEKENRQLKLYRERVRSMEEKGSISYLAVIFDAATFSDLLARLDFVFEVMRYDEELYRAYIAAKEETQKAKSALEKTKEELEATLAEEEAKKAELEQRREEANGFIADLQSTIEGFTALFAEADAAEAEVWAEVDRLLAEYEAEKKKQEEANKKDEEDEPEEEVTEPEDEEESEEEEEEKDYSSTGQFIWPAPASLIVTSTYGNRIHPVYGIERFHYGIDIGAYRGSDIVAADGGVVLCAYEDWSYGNFVMIDHGNGYITLYAHMDYLYVSEGDVVSQGEALGACGDTGTANGPHLHFEVRNNGVFEDPLDYLSGYSYVIWE